MKIQKMYAHHMRNDSHFQFHTEVLNLITRTGASRLKIEQLFEAYQALYNKEDDALKKITKSSKTRLINEADKARDITWGGLVEVCSGYTKYFEEDVSEAARRLGIVFGTYGNIARKRLNEETSALHNVLQDLQGKYAGDVALVGVGRWVAELKSRHEAFESLMQERFDEAATACEIVLRDARTEVDNAFYEITERINAFIVIEGDEAYKDFVKVCNSIIAKYKAPKHHGKQKPESDDSDDLGDLQDAEEA